MSAPTPTGHAWLGFDHDGRLMAVSIETEADDGFDHEQETSRGNPDVRRVTLDEARALMAEHGWL